MRPKKVLHKLIENVLCSSMNINREEWLSTTLSPYCSDEDLKNISVCKPEEIVSPVVLDHIADELVHITVQKTALTCGGTGIVSHLNFGLGITSDMIAYFYNLISLIQKLSYLYGWDNSFFDGKPTKETYARFRQILGYAVGDVECKYPLLQVAGDALPSVANVTAMNDNLSWNDVLIKKLLRDFALQLGKSSLAALFSSKYMLLGMSITGGWSYLSFNVYAKRIHSLLRETMYCRLEECQL